MIYQNHWINKKRKSNKKRPKRNHKKRKDNNFNNAFTIINDNGLAYIFLSSTMFEMVNECIKESGIEASDLVSINFKVMGFNENGAPQITMTIAYRKKIVETDPIQTP